MKTEIPVSVLAALAKLEIYLRQHTDNPLRYINDANTQYTFIVVSKGSSFTAERNTKANTYITLKKRHAKSNLQRNKN